MNSTGTAGTGGNVPDPDCEAAGGILKAPFCRFSFADQVSVIPAESRVQLFGEATHEVSDTVTAFVESSYSSNKISRTFQSVGFNFRFILRSTLGRFNLTDFILKGKDKLDFFFRNSNFSIKSNFSC